MKKKKGFTLIELLAIIVILAIIAVITVPIILNIIENSRKGAATDSAYGYKDSVSKAYVTKLSENKDIKLNDTYTVSSTGLTGGDFGDSEVTSLPVTVSGTAPSSGSLTYSNNVLTEGYLVIGDYTVTSESTGSVTAVKTGASGNNNTNTNNQNDNQNNNALSQLPTMAEMCPECKFIYTTDIYAIEGSNENSIHDMPIGTTNDYTTLIGEGGHPYFLGLIESTSDSPKIGRAFACGIENGTPFCLEGYDPSKYSDDDNVDNVGILSTIFPSCNADASNFGGDCYESSVHAFARDYGYVGINVSGISGASVNGGCTVSNGGGVCCY